MMKRRHAFTLIESVLAISIAATVLITLLALLPAGLDAAREAGQRAAQVRILARLRQQCAAAVVTGDFYFDAQGRPLTSRTAEAAFAVRVAAGAGIALPGDTTTCLRSVRVALSDRMMNDDPFADAQEVRVQTLLLAPASNGGAS
jgi:uncharacterized protein (TIGR02598 family)